MAEQDEWDWGADVPDYGNAAPAPEPVYDYAPPGEPAPVDQVNYTPSGEDYARHDSGEMAPVDQPQYSPQDNDYGPPTQEQQAQAEADYYAQEQPLVSNQPFADAGWDPRSMVDPNATMYRQPGPVPVALPPAPPPGPLPPNTATGPADFWVDDATEMRHWVNGKVVERRPKAAATGPQRPTDPKAPNGQIYNYPAEKAADEHAKAALDREYTRWMISTGNDKFAFDKAKQAYQQTYNQSLMEAKQREHQDTSAISLLQLLSSLRGPGNAFRYASTLAGMPNGLRDLVAAASGRFQLPAFGGGLTAAQAGAGTAGIPGLLGDVAAGGVSGAGLTAADLAGLPAGNQLNAANMNQILKNPYSRDLFSGMYEAGGQDPQKVIADYLASLPYQGGPQQGRVTGLL